MVEEYKNDFVIRGRIDLPSCLNGGNYKLLLRFSNPNIETFFELSDNIDVRLPEIITSTGKHLNYENSGYVIAG